MGFALLEGQQEKENEEKKKPHINCLNNLDLAHLHWDIDGSIRHKICGHQSKD